MAWPEISELAPFALLFSLAMLSFSHFMSLLFWNPFLAFGFGHVFFSFISFYLADLTQVMVLLFPHIVGIFNFNQLLQVDHPPSLEYQVPLTYNYLVLCLQIALYYACFILVYSFLFKLT